MNSNHYMHHDRELERRESLLREYQRLMQPYWNMKINLMRAIMPTIIIFKDGSIEHRFKPDHQELIDACDKQIADAQKMIIKLLERQYGS